MKNLNNATRKSTVNSIERLMKEGDRKNDQKIISFLLLLINDSSRRIDLLEERLAKIEEN